jgi:hydrogenase nickel incorporation protein HypA/HybF
VDELHELSIAVNILEIVRENFPADGGSKLRSIKVRVGELAGVVPDSLEFCFSAITKGTDMEQARLEIERTGIVAHCESCGVDSEVHGFAFICPACDGSDLRIISGNELSVVEIEVDG